jgi:hypothetical protein
MPYVFTTSYFPANKASELAKIYVQSIKEFNAQTRGLHKEIVPNAVKSRRDYIETTGIHDVTDNKLQEFLLAEQRYMAKFHGVEGFSYTIEVRFKVTEALETIGLKMPE